MVLSRAERPPRIEQQTDPAAGRPARATAISSAPSSRARSTPGAASESSSRYSAAGAGWACGQIGSFVDLVEDPTTSTGQPTRLSKKLHDRMYWFRLNVLWGSRNDVLSKLSDPVPGLRGRWIGPRGASDLRVDLTDRADHSFLLMGDTGEGDYSQYAVVPPLRNVADAADAEFVVICSDVIYPTGNVNDYRAKFYQPYSTLLRPIYTLPGNHDWYDNLCAYMANFGTPHELPAPPPVVPGPVEAWSTRVWAAGRTRLREALWRPPATPTSVADIDAARALRGDRRQVQRRPQPGPYYVIDSEHLRLVCIDTGIRGDIDEQQGRWLLEVSRDPRPKMLLTGKPLVVDGAVAPCPIQGSPDGFENVLSVVHDREFRYVASIGGDIHNYQHYPVKVADGTGLRTIHHVVSGGGGAFMHATHTIPVLDPDQVLGVTEGEYKAYPLRRDSLAAYSRVIQGMIDRFLPARLRPTFVLTPEEAAEALHRLLGTARERPAQQTSEEPVALTRGQLWSCRFLLHVGGHHFHSLLSPFCDWDDPPFFKHFLRVDVRAEGATIRCHAVTGCLDDEKDPPVEDVITLVWPPAAAPGGVQAGTDA